MHVIRSLFAVVLTIGAHLLVGSLNFLTRDALMTELDSQRVSTTNVTRRCESDFVGAVAEFKINLRVFASKDTEIVQGPVVNLKDTMNKRVKRRTIQLVRITQ